MKENLMMDVHLKEIIGSSIKPSKYKKSLSSYINSSVNLKEKRMSFELSSKPSLEEIKKVFDGCAHKIELMNKDRTKLVYSHVYPENRVLNKGFRPVEEKENKAGGDEAKTCEFCKKSSTNQLSDTVKTIKNVPKQFLNSMGTNTETFTEDKQKEKNKVVGIVRDVNPNNNLLMNKSSPYCEKLTIRIVKRELYRLARYSVNIEQESIFLNIISTLNGLLTKYKEKKD